MVTGHPSSSRLAKQQTRLRQLRQAAAEADLQAFFALSVSNQEPDVEAVRDGGVMHEVGSGEGSQPLLPSDRVENKSDGPTVIAAEPFINRITEAAAARGIALTPYAVEVRS